jgi:uncharacterized membrane protein YgdD (TMEM256/DUF423 family)
MNQRTTLVAGIAMAGLGVGIGAFGAHALKPILQENARTETFELAVRYQFYHSFALLFCGLMMSRLPSRMLPAAAVCFIAGIFIFSGSLYILSLTGNTILGAVTPLGGLLFLAGWVLLFIAVSKKGLE